MQCWVVSRANLSLVNTGH